jgi:small-conductance mechanosensitive channel
MTEKLIYSGIVFVAALIAVFVLRRALEASARRFNMPLLAARPLRALIHYAVVFVGIALIMEEFDLPIATLLTVVGTVAGLIAIAFVALWSVLSNFLCTLMLILFEPFSVGDDLEIPGDSVAGRVVDLTFMYTTLRSPTGEYVQVPNNMFFQKIFTRKAGTASVGLSDQLRQDQPSE